MRQRALAWLLSLASDALSLAAVGLVVANADGTSSAAGLQSMAERLAAPGGELRITSAPGSGTTIEGRLPAEARS